MDNPALLVSGNNSTQLTSVIGIALNQHNVISVSGWAVIPDVGLVLYWGEPESSQPFGPTSLALDPLVSQVSSWLATVDYHRYIGPPLDIDGDVEKGWLVYHPSSVPKPINVPDTFYVVCIIKPHYIYYGK